MLLKSAIFVAIAWLFSQEQLVFGALGERHVNWRIINGTPAITGNTKHQVSIRSRSLDATLFGDGHGCGGSLITQNVVLSAAHCFIDLDKSKSTQTFLPKENFIVVMGNLNLYERNKNTLQFDIAKIVYNVTGLTSTYEGDIALVFLNGSVPAGHPTVKTISITTAPFPDGTECRATGWGITEHGRRADKLMTVNLPIINFDVCATGTRGIVKKGMICAGYIGGNRGICAGDSGGPLVCKGVQAGIVALSFGCVEPMFPGVFTDVAYWYKWIQRQIKEHGGGISQLSDSNPLMSNGALSASKSRYFNFFDLRFFLVLYVMCSVE